MDLRNISYPYPVLSENTGDYRSESSFKCHFEIGLDKRTENLVIEIRWLLKDADLVKYLENGDLALALGVTCQSTLFNQVFTFKSIELEGGSQLEIPTASLDDQITLEPYLLVEKAIHHFSPKTLSPVYENATFTLAKSDIAAKDDAQSVRIGNDHIKFRKLIQVVLAELPPLEYNFRIPTDGNRISIRLGPDLHSVWEHKRVMNMDRHYFVMSIYKDCLVQAMELIAEDPDLDCTWARSLKAKMEGVGEGGLLDRSGADFEDLNRAAQKIFSEKGAQALFNQFQDEGSH